MEDQRLQEIVQEAGKQLGVQELRPDQERAIVAFVKGRDVFVCLPTGSGKSICFDALPLVFDALQGKRGSNCLVMSPLTALMKDQVEAFTGRGLSAAFCGPQQTEKETIDRICAGCYQLVYITPGALVNNTIYRSMLLETVWQKNLVAYVIDESHCIQDMESHMIMWCMQLILMLAWHIITTAHYHEYPCRGEDFQTAFRGLGDVRTLGNYYVAPLLFCHTLLEGSPVIPLGYLIHGWKFRETHTFFWH